MRVALAWLLLALVLASASAHGARRSLRLDAGAWSEKTFADQFPGACPGTYLHATVLDWSGYRFQGHVPDPAAFDVSNIYCQTSLGSALDRASFFGEQPLLAELIGANADGAVTAIRYTFDDFDGFQWVFYRFPPPPPPPGTIYLFSRSIVLVAYHDGPDPPPPLALHPSIVDLGFGVVASSVDLEGFDGEYFCFEQQVAFAKALVISDVAYLGRWSGEPGDEDSACYQALRHRLVVFGSGFEGGLLP